MDVDYLEDGRYPNEEWRFLLGFNRYLVSNYGRVFNTDKEELLKGRVTSNGSIRVKLSQNGDVREVYVHTLVAELYLDGYGEGYHVRHLDGDRSNNYILNLEPVGPFRDMGPNYIPEYRGGRLVRIVETDEVFPNVMVLALALETDSSTIYKCLRGERQRHLGYTYEYAD